MTFNFSPFLIKKQSQKMQKTRKYQSKYLIFDLEANLVHHSKFHKNHKKFIVLFFLSFLSLICVAKMHPFDLSQSHWMNFLCSQRRSHEKSLFRYLLFSPFSSKSAKWLKDRPKKERKPKQGWPTGKTMIH